MDIDDITFVTCYMLGDTMIQYYQHNNIMNTENSLIFKIFLGWWIIHNPSMCDLQEQSKGRIAPFKKRSN